MITSCLLCMLVVSCLGEDVNSKTISDNLLYSQHNEANNQIEKETLGKEWNINNIDVPNLLDKLDSLSTKIENIQNTFKSYDDRCQSLVGTSKPSICLQVKNTSEHVPKSCGEIKKSGKTKSGIYQIQPTPSTKPISVLCDMDTKDGGWTHIQKRFDGSQEFYLGWREYKFGFGDLNGEFWIGLENIHQITGAEHNELLIELTNSFGEKRYANYKSFAIAPENDGYRLNVLSNFSGTVGYGDRLIQHVGMRFTTKDMDQDDAYPDNCAEKNSGAWWYKSCFYSCLNGRYVYIPQGPGYHHKGIYWFTDALAGSRMLVRPVQNEES